MFQEFSSPQETNPIGYESKASDKVPDALGDKLLGSDRNWALFAGKVQKMDWIVIDD